MIYNIDLLLREIDKLNNPNNFNIDETLSSISNLLSIISRSLQVFFY